MRDLNLSGKTLEWYEDRSRRFVDWCATQRIVCPSDLRWSDGDLADLLAGGGT